MSSSGSLIVTITVFFSSTYISTIPDSFAVSVRTSLDAKVCEPYGFFSHVLKTKDFSPLEPSIVENKLYAQNTGDIKELPVQGESEESNLVQIKGGK